MFYCESCRVVQEWPESFRKSLGPCEVCGERSVCNDVQSSLLPDPPKKVTVDDTSIWW